MYQAFQTVAKQALLQEGDVELYNEFPDKIDLNSAPQNTKKDCAC